MAVYLTKLPERTVVDVIRKFFYRAYAVFGGLE